MKDVFVRAGNPDGSIQLGFADPKSRGDWPREIEIKEISADNAYILIIELVNQLFQNKRNEK